MRWFWDKIYDLWFLETFNKKPLVVLIYDLWFHPCSHVQSVVSLIQPLRQVADLDTNHREPGFKHWWTSDQLPNSWDMQFIPAITVHHQPLWNINGWPFGRKSPQLIGIVDHLQVEFWCPSQFVCQRVSIIESLIINNLNLICLFVSAFSHPRWPDVAQQQD